MSDRAPLLAAARRDLEAARARLLAPTAGKSREELLAPARDGGWSAAEILDHLRTAEGKLVKGLTKMERGEPVRLPRAAWLYRLPMSLAFTRFKVKAPGPVRPRPRAEIEPEEVLAALAASRAALLGVADRLGPERFSRLVFPHFLLGRFDGLDWFRFIGRHEARHAAQMERLFSARRAP